MENNLPEGWVNTKLNDICHMVYGKGLLMKYFTDEGFPVFGANGIIGKYSLYTYVEPQVIISCRGAASGAIHKTSPKSFVTSNSIVLELNSASINLDYFKYSLLSVDRSKIVTGSAQPQITIENLIDLSIPISPLPEQHRIVSKLDALMQKVETNKQRLDKIPKLFKRFRQSVLAAAVSGRLTEDWRAVNPNLEVYITNNEIEDYNWKDIEFPASWKWDYTKNISMHILGKMLDAAKNKGEPTLYLRNVSVRWFEFDLETLTEIKATKEEKAKFDLRDNDLFVCEGGEPGRAAIWNKGQNSYIFQKAIHRLRFNDFVNPYWVLYNLKVDADGGKLETLFTGTGIKHLTLKSLSKYPVAIPPIEEQKEIVRRVEQLFALSDTIEARYTKAKAILDKLPQSILAKAFRGELVPQDANDEAASVLLERIKLEKVKSQNLKKGRS